MKKGRFGLFWKVVGTMVALAVIGIWIFVVGYEIIGMVIVGLAIVIEIFATVVQLTVLEP